MATSSTSTARDGGTSSGPTNPIPTAFCIDEIIHPDCRAQAEQFECAICLRIPSSPVFTMCCEQVFCIDCLGELTMCANCLSPFEPNKDRSFPIPKIVQRMLYGLRMVCPHGAKGDVFGAQPGLGGKKLQDYSEKAVCEMESCLSPTTGRTALSSGAALGGDTDTFDDAKERGEGGGLGAGDITPDTSRISNLDDSGRQRLQKDKEDLRNKLTQAFELNLLEWEREAKLHFNHHLHTSALSAASALSERASASSGDYDKLRGKYDQVKKSLRAKEKEVNELRMENMLFKRLEQRRSSEVRVSEDDIRDVYEQKILRLKMTLEDRDAYIAALEAAQLARTASEHDELRQRETVEDDAE